MIRQLCAIRVLSSANTFVIAEMITGMVRGCRALGLQLALDQACEHPKQLARIELH